MAALVSEWSAPVAFTVDSYGNQFSFNSNIISPTPSHGERFGASVTVDREFKPRLSIGAEYNQDESINGGVVYHFVKTNNGYNYTDRLYSPGDVANSRFGHAIAYSDYEFFSTSLLSNEVFVFGYYVNSVTGENIYSYKQTLTPDGESGSSRFGESIFVLGDYVYIGDPVDSTQANTAGCVYVYRRTEAGIYEFVKKIFPDTPSINGLFGRAITGGNEFLFISSHCSEQAGGTVSGKVHQFTIDEEDNYTFVKTITSSSPAPGDKFGYALAYAEDLRQLIIGTPQGYYDSIRSGVCYIYSTEYEGFTYELSRPDAVEGDEFGTSLMLTPNRLMLFVGVPGYQDNEIRTGLVSCFYRALAV